jgi:lipopolysaccharide biosynthesis regulator YciM
MNANLRTKADLLHSKDANVRYAAFQELLTLAKSPVDWAYDVWDELKEMMRNGDNHQRTIAVQFLCELAQSDPKNKMLKDFDGLLAVTRDERTVTARHSLQALWKVGRVGKKQLQLVLDGYALRFKECATEKNGTLFRSDISMALKKLFDVTADIKIQETALVFIETETDPKYRKKYASVWKTK